MGRQIRAPVREVARETGGFNLIKVFVEASSRLLSVVFD
jgi:hypothetical protein